MTSHSMWAMPKRVGVIA